MQKISDLSDKQQTEMIRRLAHLSVVLDQLMRDVAQCSTSELTIENAAHRTELLGNAFKGLANVWKVEAAMLAVTENLTQDRR